MWRQDGRRLLSTRAVVLPPNAKISYLPGSNTREGRIHLLNWPNITVYTDDSEVDLKTSYDSTGLTLSLYSSTDQPGRTVDFFLQWPDGEQRLSLPFPAYGASFVKNDRVIRHDEVLSVDELIGCRVLLMSLQGAQHWRLRMTSSKNDFNLSLSQEFRYTGVHEIRMFELAFVIQQMLSCYPELEHTVKVEVIHNRQVQASLDVGRYSSRILINNNRQMITLKKGDSDLLFEEDAAASLLLGLSLSEPEQEPVNLPLHRSESVFTGNWVIDLPHKIAGPWILYTAEGSMINSRPAVFIQDTGVNMHGMGAFEAALCNSSQAERRILLRDIFQATSLSPEHRNWEKLEALIDNLHHLPLASLDIFQALIKEPQAMAMATLIMDDFSSRLAERLPKELPFEWLLISPKCWVRAIEKIRSQVSTDDPKLLEFIIKDIQSKSSFLTHWQPALEFIFKQGFYNNFDLKDQDCRLFAEQPWMLGHIWLKDIFETNDTQISEMQKMLNRNTHLKQKWPTLSSIELEQFANTEHGANIISLIDEPLRDSDMLSMILLPFMVAIDAYNDKGHEWQDNPQRLFTLRQARQFDPIWFDSAYEMGLVLAQIDLWN